MSQRSSLSNWEAQLRRLGGAYQRQWIGGLAALSGLLLLLSLLTHGAADGGAPPFLAVLAGGVAPLLALAILSVGVVLLLGRRAGYWSAEALLGAELLLLGLPIWAYVTANDQVNWAARLDGSAGGLIGWALGNLLMAAFGRWLALLAAALLVLAGVVLLVRYTPLVYAAAAGADLLGRWLPSFQALGERLGRAGKETPPHTATFVAPSSETASHSRAAPTGLRRPPTAFVTPDSPPSAPAAPNTAKSRTRPTAPAPANNEQAAIPAARLQPPANAAAGAPARQTKGTGKQAAAVAVRPAHLLPPLDLLTADAGSYGNTDVAELEQIILGTLEDFDVPVRVVHVETGPTVTQFGVEPLYTERAGQRRKVRVNRIVGLANDLALALAAPAVRIEAPVPGRPYVGIEVPNPDKSLVSLRGIVESSDMAKGGALVLPLGRNTAGHPVVMDLTKAPHMLIAGATGSGKSVCINTIITGLLMKHGPESLRFILVDPKMVELPGYNGIPHLYGKVITDVEHVMGALTWLLLQMDDRYQMFRDLGVRNVESYNLAVRKSKDAGRCPLSCW